jgi:hypothetical protein
VVVAQALVESIGRTAVVVLKGLLEIVDSRLEFLQLEEDIADLEGQISMGIQVEIIA